MMRGIVACLLFASWTLPLAAQEQGVTGIILDSVSRRPLEGASVYFTTLPGENRTGPDGRFRLRVSAPGDTLMVARRIGFVPTTFTVHLIPGIPVSDVGFLQLRPVATKLDEIAVEAEQVRRFPVLEGFYQRKANLEGLGHFFTRDIVERSGGARTSDILRRSHKLEIECGRQGSALCVATSRRARETRFTSQARDSTNIEDNAIAFDAGRCRMDVWVDGVRSPFDLDTVPVEWIVGIEIYSGPATTPAVFGMGACGVIAIWTAVPGA
jgi:hypothetical protein